MKPRALKMWMVVSLLTFFSSALAVPFALASSPGNAQKVDVAVMVSQKGFSDYRGKLFGDRNVLEVPKDAVVRITFVFDEKMTSLAYGDTHQFALAGHAEGSKESEKIWMFSKQSSITFQSGNAGDHYRAYCILDCIGDFSHSVMFDLWRQVAILIPAFLLPLTPDRLPVEVFS